MVEMKSNAIVKEHFSAEAIVAGITAKRPEVFRYLAGRYGPAVRNHVRRNSGRGEEDETELLQLTLTQLWMAVRDGRYQEEGKLDQYVYQLATNLWHEELRRRKNREPKPLEETTYGMLDESEDELARAVAKDQQLEAMHASLEQLGEPCRQIIRWFHLEQVSLQDIAERLTYDYNALRKRIFDCRKKLRNLVVAYLGHNPNTYGNE